MRCSLDMYLQNNNLRERKNVRILRVDVWVPSASELASLSYLYNRVLNIKIFLDYVFFVSTTESLEPMTCEMLCQLLDHLSHRHSERLAED